MSTLESNKELAENKLILLYIMDKTGIPMSNLQITRLILENKFMNYFMLQQYLNELTESKFLSTDTAEDRITYRITEAGRQSLGYFSNLIPSGIKARMDSSFSDI